MSAYHQPDRLDEALALMAEVGPTVVAGCTDLFATTEAPMLAGAILDITRIPALRGIEQTPRGWRIGAATTWTEILAAELPPAFDMLRQAAREVGSVQIQNAGTVAGNLCNASPAADGVPPLLSLDAEIELASASGRRRLPLGAFLTGPRETALAPTELVVAIHIPAHAGLGESAFRKLGSRRYLVISIAMVAARLVVDRDVVREAAISVGSCSAAAVRLPEVEAATTGLSPAAAPDCVTTALVGRRLSPITDVRGDAAYRTEAATELVRRAVADAAAGWGS